MERIVIYGAGKIGKKLFTLLKSRGIIPVCFVVSKTTDKISDIDGIRVVSLYEMILESVDPSIVYVAMDESNWNRVKELLDSLCSNVQFEIKWIGNDQLLSLEREYHPVDPRDFLYSVEPISSVFGLDRGTPIDRYYIEQFLEKEKKEIDSPHKLLEVGETTYIRRFFSSDNSQYDMLDFSKGIDLTKHDTLPENYYDLFVCTQVYNFIYDVRQAIQGSYKLLKNGGVLLATVAGNISQISAYDMDRWGDYWRFTTLGIKKLVVDVFGNDVKVISYGNSMAATAFIQGLAVEDIKKELLNESDSNYSVLIGVYARKHIYD